MKYERSHDRLIYEQAAQWHVRMQKEPGSQERAQFDHWLQESRRHIRSYLLVVALDRELTRMGADRLPKDELPEVAVDAVVPLPRRAFHSRVQNLRWPWLASAAALVLVVSGFLLGPWPLGGRYKTDIGEQQIVKLNDGSVMYLNTHSQAQVKYSDTSRDIRLLAGEALFVVARDAARPFRVETGSATIQAIGTEFNVYRRGMQTAVSVVEGRVQVLTDKAPLPLNAGEAADVGNNGLVTKRAGTNVGTAVAWRDRRLVFREDSLANIASEFNRYNEAPRLRIEGADAQARRYSGIFDAYDPYSLAQVLSADGELIVDESRREIVIRRR